MSLAELMGNYGTRLIPGRREMRLPSWDRVPVRSLLFSRHFLNWCPTISSPSCTPTFETVESGQKTIWIAKYLQQIALLSRYFYKLQTNYESYMWGISVVVSYFWWNVYCMLLWSKLERIIFWCDAVEIVFTTCLISLENNISPRNALPLHYYILFAYASFCDKITVKNQNFQPLKTRGFTLFGVEKWCPQYETFDLVHYCHCNIMWHVSKKFKTLVKLYMFFALNVKNVRLQIQIEIFR